MEGAGLERATACVFAVAKPSATKNMLVESTKAAISRGEAWRRSTSGISFCPCPFWAWRHKTPKRDATLCVRAHGKLFCTARELAPLAANSRTSGASPPDKTPTADLATFDHDPVIGEAKWGASPAIQATDFLAGCLTMESVRGQFAGLMA